MWTWRSVWPPQQQSRQTMIVGLTAFFMASVSCRAGHTEVATEGSCNPVFKNINGDISISLTCSRVGNVINYHFSKESIDFIRAYFDIDSLAAANMLRTLNNEKIPPYKLPERIKQLVDEVKYLRGQVRSYSSISEAKDLTAEIDRALSAMDLAKAKQVFKSLISKFEEISEAQRSMENIINVAKSKRDLGKLLMSAYEYDEAFSNFKSALEWTPGRFESQTVELQVEVAEAGILGSQPTDIVGPLVEVAVFATRNYQHSASSLYLRALQLQIMHSNSLKNYKKSIELFEKNLQPILSDPKNPLLLDVRNIVLCLSCTVSAALNLEEYKKAEKIGAIAITIFRGSSKTLSEDLVAIFVNHAIALSNLHRDEEAKNDLQSALQILKLRAPDGLHPSYPFVWVNLGSMEKNAGQKKDYYKKAILALAQNLPIYQDVGNEIIQKVTGSGGGLLCFRYSNKNKETLGDVSLIDPPLHDFDPTTCSRYAYFDTGDFRWTLDDITEIRRGIKEASRKYARDVDDVSVSVSAGLCTEFIIGGWQDFGRQLCTESLKLALEKNVRTAQVAEAMFRAAQFSELLGYDFGLGEEDMYTFAFDTFILTRGINHEFTIDALITRASYFYRRGRGHDGKQIILSFIKGGMAPNREEVNPENVKKLHEFLRSPPRAENIVSKRRVYASPFGNIQH